MVISQEKGNFLWGFQLNEEADLNPALLISLDIGGKGRAEDIHFHSINHGIDHETLITLVPTIGKGLWHHQEEGTIRDNSVLVGHISGGIRIPIYEVFVLLIKDF